MLTYQDWESAGITDEARADFIELLITQHKGSEEVNTALDADEYDAQRNPTIRHFSKVIYTMQGRAVKDFTAANNRIAGNFFHTMNTRRCSYSLGNGVEFTDKATKEKLGQQFDTRLKEAARLALIHGRAYLFLNVDRVHVFKTTEFAPLIDEHTGRMRAGVRYWQLAEDKPLNVTLYEEDGYTVMRRTKGERLHVTKEKRAYRVTTERAPADEEETPIGWENYPALPIVMLWGGALHQSTLVGMRGALDAYDLIRSGFADDLQDCAQIYWILENYNGMNEDDLARFRDRLKLQHIAAADTGDGGRVSAHTQEIPHTARETFLTNIRAGLYEDFGLLDLKTLSAAATNDHIDAAYQAQDDMADDFEYQIIDAVQQLLALIGVEDTPEFKRGRISNRKELVEMLVMEAGMVDMPEEVLLRQMPNLTPEQVEETLEAMTAGEARRIVRTGADEDGDA